MKENKFWEVKFKFNYPKDSAEDIRVVGNIESLGMWKIDKAIKLIYDPKKECWETKSYIKIPTGFDLEYKYLIFKDNDFIKEEEINAKRKVAIPEQEKLILSADKDSPETNIQKHFVKMKKKSSKDINNKIPLKSALKNGSKKNNTKLKETKKNQSKIGHLQKKKILMTKMI